MLEYRRPDRKEDDGNDRRDHETFSDLFVGEIQERNVEDDQKNSERHARDVACHDRQPDDASVDDVIRNQKQFQTDRRNRRADAQLSIFLNVSADACAHKIAPVKNIHTAIIIHSAAMCNGLIKIGDDDTLRPD